MRQVLIWLLLVLAFVMGCSSGSSVMNPSPPGDKSVDDKANSVPVIGASINGDIFSAIGVMGSYELKIDPEGTDVELIAQRSSYIGESYIVSGTGFFTMRPCSDCLKVKRIGLDAQGFIVLGMAVKHPFRKGDPLKPPTGLNRLDLDILDLALLMLPLDATASTYPLIGADIYPGILVNADGYTTELANVVNETSALPYKICFEDQNNNRFEMGTEYQDFEMVISPGSGVSFNLYLTMGYGASAKKADRLIPIYYIPEFNRKPPWKVVVVPPNGSNPPEIGNTWDDLDTTTEYTISIDIYDWNHGATIASSYPDPLHTDYISAASDISQVSVEVPGMISAPVIAQTNDTVTNGWDDPITYTASFANENAIPAGEYLGLVKVADTRVPGQSIIGGETDTLVYQTEDITLEWYNINEFTTYQVFDAYVVAGHIEAPPVGNVKITVNRIDTYVDAYQVNGTNPFTLEWLAPGSGIPEYAIYVDRNPDDGLTNDLQFAGTTTTTTYKTPSSELPANHYIKGYTYIVRSRQTAGDPSSESADSQPAHVIVTGFETHPPPTYSPLNGEGWLANGQSTSTDRYTRPISTGANWAHGVLAVMFSRKVGNPATAGLWDGMVLGPIPSIPNSTVRFMDFSLLWRNVLDGGLFWGTCSTKPASGWTNPAADFDWSSSVSTGVYVGYNGYHADICTLFNGCPPSGNNVIYDPASSTGFQRRKVGGDVNEFGDPSDQYVGIECYRTSIPDESVPGNYSNIFLDEVAIAIY